MSPEGGPALPAVEELLAGIQFLPRRMRGEVLTALAESLHRARRAGATDLRIAIAVVQGQLVIDIVSNSG